MRQSVVHGQSRSVVTWAVVIVACGVSRLEHLELCGRFIALTCQRLQQRLALTQLSGKRLLFLDQPFERLLTSG